MYMIPQCLKSNNQYLNNKYVPVDILSNVKAIIGILQLSKSCVCIVMMVTDE